MKLQVDRPRDKHVKKNLKTAALLSLVLALSPVMTACQGASSNEQVAVAAGVTTASASSKTTTSKESVTSAEETEEIKTEMTSEEETDSDTAAENAEADVNSETGTEDEADESSAESENTSEEDGADVNDPGSSDNAPEKQEAPAARAEVKAEMPAEESELETEPETEPENRPAAEETEPESEAAPASPTLLPLPRYIDQVAEGAPMGCEAASLLMALQSTGHCTGMNYHQFLDTMPYASDGNPNHGFVGTPYANDGNFDGINMPAVTSWGARYANTADLTGCSEDTLIDQLNQGHSLVVWTSYQFGPTQREDFWWGSYKTHAHVMTLLGYNPQTSEFYIADPAPGGSWSGQGWVSWSTFTASFDVMRGAVAVW